MSVKCPNCHKEFETAPKFCDGCGFKFEQAAPQPAPQPAPQRPPMPQQSPYQPQARPQPPYPQQAQPQFQQQQQYQQQYQQSPYQQQYQPQYQQPQYPRMNVDSNAKVLSAFVYLFPVFFFICLLQNPKDNFFVFHANQSLLRMLLSLASVVVGIIPILGWIAVGVIGIFNFVCLIMGLVAVYNGQQKPLPIIGKYTLIH